MTSIIYSGTDITQDIDLMSCVYTDTNGGKQDSCKISFSNAKSQWNEWKPQFDDVVRVKKGNCDSGEMYVNSIAETNGIYTLLLLSTPTSTKKRKNKVWRDVKLSEIISDVSKETGFKSLLWGFSDVYYKSLTQNNQTSLAFLSDICRLEGYNIKIFNNQIVVFSEKAIKEDTPKANIDITDVKYKAFEKNETTVKSVTIRNYDVKHRNLISYTATNENKKGIDIRKNIYVTDYAQCERWAVNLLENYNKQSITASLKIKYADTLASGSIVKLNNFNDNDGKYYIYSNVVDMVYDDCFIDLYKVGD